MKKVKLRTEILLLFLVVIVLLSGLTSIFGYYVMKKYIVGKTQDQVMRDLKTVRMVYEEQLEKIEKAFILANPTINTEEVKKIMGLDYLCIVEKPEQVRSEIVRESFQKAKPVGGNRIILREELLTMGEGVLENAQIVIKPTPKARPSDRRIMDNAMALEYAKPFMDQGKVIKILYGGKIINKNFRMIDEISDTVFEKKLYQNKPIGTFTIFLDDVRIATNVLDREGQRAVGTRVSDIVYRKVIEHRGQWIDRAFVVTDWYLSAYEPIKDIDGKIIGILYVGILEKPYIELERNLFLVFLLIVSVVTMSALVIAAVFASKISKPVTDMRDATAKIAAGDLQYRLKNDTAVRELSQLTASLNLMAEKLQEREQRLKVANEKLAVLNKNYLDMIGFVSHELKGLLGSIVMNVYSVKDGYLGSLNDSQSKAINSAAKTLDYFENMVKNYLDLSRIEKGNLQIVKTRVRFQEDILLSVMGNFEKERQRKNMTVESHIPTDFCVSADKNLMTIVCNNLLGNALKYGSEGGRVTIDAKHVNDFIEFCFYNDGQPIPDAQRERLFKRFSRLPGSEKIKGTGLGLFIVKEIVEKHGGRVWCEPKAAGNVFAFTISKN